MVRMHRFSVEQKSELKFRHMKLPSIFADRPHFTMRALEKFGEVALEMGDFVYIYHQGQSEDKSFSVLRVKQVTFSAISDDCQKRRKDKNQRKIKIYQ